MLLLSTSSLSMYLGAAMFVCKKRACFPTIVALELEEDDYNKGCGRTIQKQTTLDQDIFFINICFSYRTFRTL